MNSFIGNPQTNFLLCEEKYDAKIHNVIHWHQSSLSTTQSYPEEISNIKIILI